LAPSSHGKKHTENTEKSFFPWLALRVALIFGIGDKWGPKNEAKHLFAEGN